MAVGNSHDVCFAKHDALRQRGGVFPRRVASVIRRPARRWAVLGLCLLPLAVLAWGPHPAITQAALDVLPTDDALARRLGAQTQRLTNYCWLADFKRLPFREPEQDFYADDYLLFPQAPAHLDHICPEVKKTYRPYFLRALQALRTESPANAARWVGSLLHFVEDTGSPPHAAELRGDVHVKMENWINPALIQIAGHRPRLLGTNDADALDGFLKRMDGLIEFSKPRGKGLVTKVVIGHRAAVEPVVLECAQETSRVTADLLHTLGCRCPAQRRQEQQSQKQNNLRWAMNYFGFHKHSCFSRVENGMQELSPG